MRAPLLSLTTAIAHAERGDAAAIYADALRGCLERGADIHAAALQCSLERRIERQARFARTPAQHRAFRRAFELAVMSEESK